MATPRPQSYYLLLSRQDGESSFQFIPSPRSLAPLEFNPSETFPRVFLHWLLSSHICWLMGDGFLALVFSLPSPPVTGFPALSVKKNHPGTQIPGPLSQRAQSPGLGLESDPCQPGLENASAPWLGHLHWSVLNGGESCMLPITLLRDLPWPRSSPRRRGFSVCEMSRGSVLTISGSWPIWLAPEVSDVGTDSTLVDRSSRGSSSRPRCRPEVSS